MNFIAPRAEPLIREIPLSRLALAPENVRKTPPDPRADAELKASIAALGLLENLVVRADEPGEDGTDRYAVVAGGRRLKAMQALVEEEVFDADHPVPCQVRSGDAESGEVSLAENVIRVPMHPADQVVAFSKLADAGQSVSPAWRGATAPYPRGRAHGAARRCPAGASIWTPPRGVLTMPQVIEITIYTIDELSDGAKEAARAWYRESCLDYEWYDFVYEDFQTICGILGVTLATSPVRLYGGGTRDKPQVWFTGFWNQGDGASFSGHYSHAKGAAKAIRAYAPKDDELHRIADALQAVQRRNFWQLHSTIGQRGRYCHEYTMTIEVERDSPTWQPPTDDAEDAVTEAMRDLARWLYRQLRAEYEHLTSDEAIDETLAANESTFTAAGEYFV